MAYFKYKNAFILFEEKATLLILKCKTIWNIFLRVGGVRLSSSLCFVHQRSTQLWSSLVPVTHLIELCLGQTTEELCHNQGKKNLI